MKMIGKGYRNRFLSKSKDDGKNLHVSLADACLTKQATKTKKLKFCI
jgi:hypothetical protein